MWDSSSGGFGSPKKSSRWGSRAANNARTTARRARGRFHLRRIPVEMKESKSSGLGTTINLMPGRILSLDFTPQQLSVYSIQPLSIGTEISVTIDFPSRFYCKGKVVAIADWRRDSHIVADPVFPYRISIRLEFDSEAEKLAIAEFVKRFTGSNFADFATKQAA